MNSLGVLKNPFAARNAEKMRNNAKNEGENGDI